MPRDNETSRQKYANRKDNDRAAHDAMLERARDRARLMYTHPGRRVFVLQTTRLQAVLQKRGGKMLRPMRELVGCHVETLMLWIESNFEDGMSWDNMGQEWQLDHVVPMKAFDLTTEESQKKCCCWSNLFPLEIKANQRKGAEILDNYIQDVQQRAKCFMNECDCC